MECIKCGAPLREPHAIVCYRCAMERIEALVAERGNFLYWHLYLGTGNGVCWTEWCGRCGGARARCIRCEPCEKELAARGNCKCPLMPFQ